MDACVSLHACLFVFLFFFHLRVWLSVCECACMRVRACESIWLVTLNNTASVCTLQGVLVSYMTRQGTVGTCVTLVARGNGVDLLYLYVSGSTYASLAAL